MREKFGAAVWRFFAAAAAVTLLITIILCVQKTQYDIIVQQIIKKPFYFLIAFFVLGLALQKAESFLEKYRKPLLTVFLVLYGVTVFLLGVGSRAHPCNDSGEVYQGALYVAGLSEDIGWHYFARCHNNVMPMLYLGALFKLAAWLGIKDVWYAAVTVNVLYVLAALYCVFWLGRRRGRHKEASAWLGMLMLAFYFPILGHTQSTYTDAFSFCFGIGAFCLWLRNQESGRTGRRYQLGNVLAGLVWAAGTQLKITVVISLVAVVCYLILFAGLREAARRCAAAVALVIALAVGCSSLIKVLPCKEYEDAWGLPTLGYFIAVGLTGNGGWDPDSEYFGRVCGEWGKDKWTYTKQYIWENRGNFVDPEHLTAKLRHNFAVGTMVASDFFWMPEKEGLVYSCAAYLGEHHEPYRIWITGYWYFFLIMGFIAWLSRAVLSRGREDIVIFVAIMSMFGIMLYAMISEANNRQLYNHLPWIATVANMGMWIIFDAAAYAGAKVKQICARGKDEG